MIARGIAGFLGVFALVNSIGGVFIRGFDANIWWIRTAPFPQWAGNALLMAAGMVLLACAAGQMKNVVLRRLGIAILAVVIAFTLANSIEFLVLSARGSIRAWAPVPM